MTLEENLESLAMKLSTHRTLHIFVCWDVWKARKFYIFEGKPLNVFARCVRILSLYKDYALIDIIKRPQKITNLPALTYATGFFDGATKNGICGVEIVLKLNDDHHFKLWMNCVLG